MELAINNGKSMSVSDAVFGREFSEDLVHQVVVAYRNAGRAGTKAQKTRSEVNGTTKKSKKQKGGGARHGALTAPIFVGGGVTFAAKPRSFAQKVNRKQYRAAMAAILTSLSIIPRPEACVQTGQAVGLDQLHFHLPEFPVASGVDGRVAQHVLIAQLRVASWWSA